MKIWEGHCKLAKAGQSQVQIDAETKLLQKQLYETHIYVGRGGDLVDCRVRPWFQKLLLKTFSGEPAVLKLVRSWMQQQ